MRTSIIIVFLSFFISFQSTSQTNDFENCDENYESILCDPIIIDTISFLYNFAAQFDTIEGVTVEWEFGFAVLENNEFYYYQFVDLTTEVGNFKYHYFYDCQNINIEGICVIGIEDLEDGCYDISLNNWIYSLTDFNLIPITDINSYSSCNDPQPFDDLCNPCGGIDCIDISIIDLTVQCPQNYDPICGCDGKTYTNSCIAQNYYGVTEWMDGPCSSADCIDEGQIDEDIVCPSSYQPVCGCDGKTYNNSCIAQNYFGIIDWVEGVCPDNECIDSTLINDLPCPDLYEPVCGCDGVTYPNECYAVNSGVIFWSAGACDTDTDCIDPDLIDEDLICPQVFDPVCGCDGITYANACSAQSAGIINYQMGECNSLECDSFEFAPLPIIASPDSPIAMAACNQFDFDPVCGCDGITYDNACFAYYNGVEYYEDGVCGSQPCVGPMLDIQCPQIFDPVCGCDGNTYGNDCVALQSGIQSWTPGECDLICILPANILYLETNITQTSARLSVENGPISALYKWQYRKVGEPWPSATQTSNSFISIFQLSPCMDYEWRVEIICENGVSTGNSAIQDFETLCPCINIDQINPDIACPQVFDPVCGCDGVTYSNSCIAYYHHGITEWTDEPCSNTDCIDESQIDTDIQCAQFYAPVCGCDGKTYNNSCVAQFYYGIIEWTDGVCEESECIDTSLINDLPCYQLYLPVCGCDGVTYPNDCYAISSGVISWTEGPCNDEDECIDPDLIEEDAYCPLDYNPVCGCDGVTYPNACSAQVAGVTSYIDGPCNSLECDSFEMYPLPILGSPDSQIAMNACNQFGDNPVCGCDGITYQNSCFAYYNGVEYYENGECGSQPCMGPTIEIDCPAIYDPVCGCDGMTYGNDCVAVSAGIQEWIPGECDLSCTLPANIAYLTTNISKTTARLNVVNGPENATYIWYLMELNDWDFIGTSTNAVRNLAQLEECRTYKWRVEIICENGISAGFSGTIEFSTLCDEDCILPANIEYITTNITENTASFEVINGPPSAKYRWQFRLGSTPLWSFLGESNDPLINVGQLDACTVYEWRVEIFCENEISGGFSNVVQFETLNCGDLEFIVVDQDAIIGSEVCVPIIVNNFIDMTIINFDVLFTDSELEFTSLNSTSFENSSEYDYSLVTSSKLNINWLDGSFECVNKNDGTEIFNICFEVLDLPQSGSNISIDIIESYDCNFNFIESISFDGKVFPIPCIDPSLIDENIQCPQVFEPVCGCDGKTYSNSCVAEKQFGIAEWILGPCNSSECINLSQIDETVNCPSVYAPVCGCNGKTYNNSCIAENYFGILEWTLGSCPGSDCIDISLVSDFPCPEVYAPVCGCDGITYPNECYAVNSGVIYWDEGPCAGDECIDLNLIDENVICPQFYEPVCGCDGVTYANECFAKSAGVINYLEGECNGVSCDGFEFAPLPVIAAPDTPKAMEACDQFGDNPVCGCDGITYQNACYAYYNGVEYYSVGECGTQLCTGPMFDNDCPAVIEYVCGCDGVTYNNACEAVNAGIQEWTDGECPNISCELDQEPFVDIRNTMETSVDVVIENVEDGLTFLVQYRPINESSVQSYLTTQTTSKISNLQLCTTYECIVEVYCENELLGYATAPIIFKTKCEDCSYNSDVEFVTLDITKTSARLNIEMLSTDYETLVWLIKKKEDDIWSTIGSGTPSAFDATSLIECTEYQWKVEIYCANFEFGGSSDVIEFKTECTNATNDTETPNVSIHPLPADAFVHMTSNVPFTSFELYDVSGKRVYSRILPVRSISERLDIQNYLPGIYVLKIYYDDKEFVVRRIAVYR